EAARSLPSDSAVPPAPVTPPTAPPVPSLRETAPASSSARTSRILSAPPKFAVACAFSPRLTPYTLSLWIGEFFRGSLVRVAGAGKRTKEPVILSMDEFRKLLAEVTEEPCRTMVLLAACLGLRTSEIL